MSFNRRKPPEQWSYEVECLVAIAIALACAGLVVATLYAGSGLQ